MIKKNHSLSNQILDPSLHRNISLNKRPKCHATNLEEMKNWKAQSLIEKHS